MQSNYNETNLQGLTEQEALERLAQDGYNELPSTKKRTFLHILLEVVREPMFLMLIACGLLYLFLGDLEEALMLMGFVVVIIGITFYQEQKTERALEALRDLSSPRALVIRDGRQQRIAGREVVRDDIILLSRRRPRPGGCRPAFRQQCLSVDESLLTGRIGAGAQSDPGMDGSRWAAPVATTCPLSTPAHWWSKARALPRSAPPVRAPKLARSARHCKSSNRRIPIYSNRPERSCATSPWLASACACWWWSFSA